MDKKDLRDYCLGWRKYLRRGMSQMMPQYADFEPAFKTEFVEQIFKIIQKEPSIRGTQKRDVFQDLSSQRIISQLCTFMHNLCQAIWVNLLHCTALKWHVHISCVVVSNNSFTAATILPAFSISKNYRQTMHVTPGVLQPIAIPIKWHGWKTFLV